MLIIFSLSILLFFFFLSKYLSKKNDKNRKNSHDIITKQIKNEWKLIKIKSTDCQIINFDTIVNSKSIKKDEENFFEWINFQGDHDKFVTEKRSKLICNQIQGNTIIKSFTEIIKIDNTVLEFKVKLRDYIDVYILDETEDYYIDLDFLNLE